MEREIKTQCSWSEKKLSREEKLSQIKAYIWWVGKERRFCASCQTCSCLKDAVETHRYECIEKLAPIIYNYFLQKGERRRWIAQCIMSGTGCCGEILREMNLCQAIKRDLLKGLNTLNSSVVKFSMDGMDEWVDGCGLHEMKTTCQQKEPVIESHNLNLLASTAGQLSDHPPQHIAFQNLPGLSISEVYQNDQLS